MFKEKLIKKQPFKNKWALICGGSKGIGKAVAKEIVRLGGNVCVLARDLVFLKRAVDDISEFKANSEQKIEIISCDTRDMEKLKVLIVEFIDINGIPDYLLNFVGISFPDYLENLTIDDFKKHMNTNFYGQLNPILILLPFFKENKGGYIVNASSVSGYIGQMGYAAYTPTKFAILGLSESLRHELKPYNINISVICPPDTDTPGLQEELATRPEELNIISESWGGLLSPEKVAEKYIKELLKKEFYIMPGSSKFLWRIMRLFPKLVHRISDRDLRKARKKLGKN
ncbi:MAG: SDR family oxidoreductase [Candidatus Lokiarchaeota archaeon]|nr:SDR family oxidoreductase [Candidatus Lokiarchaeota archaeon]